MNVIFLKLLQQKQQHPTKNKMQKINLYYLLVCAFFGSIYFNNYKIIFIHLFYFEYNVVRFFN
jgi:hypothetical protein